MESPIVCWHECPRVAGWYVVSSGVFTSLISTAGIAAFRDKTLLFPGRNIVESALYVKKNGAQYMGFRKCDMAKWVLNGCEKRAVDVITD